MSVDLLLTARAASSRRWGAMTITPGKQGGGRKRASPLLTTGLVLSGTVAWRPFPDSFG